MKATNLREGIEMLFRSHPQLCEDTCKLDWKPNHRTLIFEVHRSCGGVRVTFGRAIRYHIDAVERAYEAAIRMRRDQTSAVSDRQFVREEG